MSPKTIPAQLRMQLAQAPPLLPSLLLAAIVWIAVTGTGCYQITPIDPSDNGGGNNNTNQQSNFIGTIADQQAINQTNQATMEQMGAKVVENRVTIWINPGENRQITLEIDGTGRQFPGNFGLGPQPSGGASSTTPAYGTFKNSEGQMFTSTLGNITLDLCPSAQGTKLTGKLDTTQFNNVIMPSNSITISGTFQVWVLQAQTPTITCGQ